MAEECRTGECRCKKVFGKPIDDTEVFVPLLTLQGERWNLVNALLEAPHVNVKGWKDRKGRDSEYLIIDQVDDPKLLKLFLGNLEDEKREVFLDYARKTEKVEAEKILKK